MGPLTKELLSVLDSLITLLDEDGQTHWSTWMGKSKSRIEASNYSGITLLLGAYGGMGSFNDLIICQTNIDGKFTWKEGHIAKNEQLDHLRSLAWGLAEDIKQDQN